MKCVVSFEMVKHKSETMNIHVIFLFALFLQGWNKNIKTKKKLFHQPIRKRKAMCHLPSLLAGSMTHVPGSMPAAPSALHSGATRWLMKDSCSLARCGLFLSMYGLMGSPNCSSSSPWQRVKGQTIEICIIQVL